MKSIVRIITAQKNEVFHNFLSVNVTKSGVSCAVTFVGSYRFFNFKKVGAGQFASHHGFSKNVSSKERVKPCSLVTFYMIIIHIFLENLIEISQVI